MSGKKRAFAYVSTVRYCTRLPLHAPAPSRPERGPSLWQLSLPPSLARWLACFALYFSFRSGSRSRSRSRSTFFAHQMFPCAACNSRHLLPNYHTFSFTRPTGDRDGR